jgi:hypothetical protein
MATAIATSKEEVEAIVAEIAAAKPAIEFAVKVARGIPGSSMPTPVAHLSGAKAAHLTAPETWLPELCGGGTYVLTILDPTVDRSVGKALGVLRSTIPGQPIRSINTSITQSEKWRGPSSIDWTADAPASALVESLPTQLPAAPVRLVPQLPSTHPQAAAVDATLAAELATLRAQSAQLQDAIAKANESARQAAVALEREREERRHREEQREREERHRAEMAKIKAEADAKVDALAAQVARLAALAEAAAKAPPVAVSSGPTALDLLLKSYEDRDKDRQAQMARDEAQRKWQAEEAAANRAAMATLNEKIANRGTDQVEGISKMAQMMGTMMSTSLTAVQTTLDMQRAMQPQAEPRDSTSEMIEAAGNALSKVIPAFRAPVAPTPGQPQQAQLPQHAQTQPQAVPQPGAEPEGEPADEKDPRDDGQPPSANYLKPFADHLRRFGEPSQFAKNIVDELFAGPSVDAVRLRRVFASNDSADAVALELFAVSLADWFNADQKKAKEYLAKVNAAVESELEMRSKMADAAEAVAPAKAATRPPAKA